MVRVRNAGIHRTDLSTLGRVVVANTLSTLVGVDYIAGLPF